MGLGEQGRKISEVKLELSCWDRCAVSLLREVWLLSKHERGKKGGHASLLMYVIGFYHIYFFLSLRLINTKQFESVGLCVFLKAVAKL